MALVNQTNVTELSDGNPDGNRMGQSATDLVGFHGATPSDQRAILTLATAATILTTTVAVQEIKALLIEKGLMAAS